MASTAASSKSALYPSATTTTADDVPSNPRGIPAAPFIANVEEHIGGPEGDCEGALRKFQEMSAKYRYMELNLSQRRKGLEAKIPDIRRTVGVVEYLLSRQKGSSPAEDDDELNEDEDGDDEDDNQKPIKTLFELNDTLFAEAEVEETGTVNLWLGANVMLSYPLAEALELLTAKLSGAERALENVGEDVEFIREQATIMDVNLARVYNYDVKRRREAKEKAAKTGRSEEIEDVD